MGRTSLAERARRSGSKPAEAIAARKAAIDLMPAPLLKKMQEIERDFSGTRASNLKFYHALGGKVLEIMNNAERYQGTDGTSGLILLERALSTQGRTLRRAATFATRFTDRDLDRLIGLHNKATRFQLHWGHVTYLLTVDDKEKLWDFAKTACSEHLDPPALHERIKKSERRRKGHGRKHALPATCVGQARQIRNVTVNWNNKATQVWDGEETSAVANLLAVPPEEVNDELITMLVETQENLRAQAEKALQMADQFARIIERARGINEENKKQAAEVAAQHSRAGKESRSIDLDSDTTEAPAARARSAVRRSRAAVA